MYYLCRWIEIASTLTPELWQCCRCLHGSMDELGWRGVWFEFMKINFEKDYLRELYEKGKAQDKKHRFQPQVVKGYVKCVRVLYKARRIEDLFPFRSLNYEKLQGDKKGLSSVRINNQYRLEFREIASADDSAVIEICSLTDITNHYK